MFIQFQKTRKMCNIFGQLGKGKPQTSAKKLPGLECVQEAYSNFSPRDIDKIPITFSNPAGEFRQGEINVCKATCRGFKARAILIAPQICGNRHWISAFFA
jgi:hypothetical protein